MNLLELLLKPVIWLCEKTGRVFHITGTGGPDDVYLIRYYVFKSSWFNCFIHIFLRSDRDDMHDHPWNFGTYIVRGGYTEEVPCERCFQNDQPIFCTSVNYRNINEHRWGTRKAEQLHRVKLDEEYKLVDKHKAPMTLFFSGKTRRDWGFVKDGQWINWKKYLGLPEDTKSRG